MLKTLAIAASILVAEPALARNAAPGVPSNPSVPMAPSNTPALPPEKIAPPDQSLSGQLSQQKGTIVPPNVDPGITVKAPLTGGKTPVIPPPGSTGGNLSVVPK